MELMFKLCDIYHFPYFRIIYDMLFYFIVIIIVLNLIFGVIIDTFADLRSEKQTKEEVIKNSCFICGLERKASSFLIKSREDFFNVVVFFLYFSFPFQNGRDPVFVPLFLKIFYIVRSAITVMNKRR
jgi:hypothetical protein